MQDRIKAVIAAVARVSPDRVVDDARLADIGLGTSIAISILKTRLKDEAGIETGALTWRSRVADVHGGALPPASAPSAPRAATTPSTRAEAPAMRLPEIGLDLQDVAALPEWPDAFYQDHFTDAEIARGRERPDARLHFCGIWCAKEAARKASPALAALPFRAIEIDADAAGKPFLRVHETSLSSLRVSISITHTETSAAAVALAQP